ncbi:MAG: integral rane protein interacts with FtsH [Solirubrobacterales bacterium]|nr:integral rane protein interacts with FtsH [Solirubrobacterales bacterium]
MPSFSDLTAGRIAAPARTDSRAVFGQVMGLVAFTCLFCALGAYVGKDASRGAGFLAFIVAFGCLMGLNAANARSQQLGIGLLFAVGLLLGVGLGPILQYYVDSDPGVVYQSAGATAGFVGILGAYGYATRRDLSGMARGLFFALIGLLLFGIVTLFVSIPGGNVIYAVLGLVVFGAYTIFDFNRLQRAGMEQATLIAASIFLDVLNVFQFMLLLFGGGGRR